MKRMIYLFVFVTLAATVFSAEQTQTTERPGMKVRQAFEIRRQMRQIEEQTVSADPELKKLADEIREKNRDLHTRVSGRLSDNASYQELKTRLNTIRAEWQKNPGRDNRKDQEYASNILTNPHTAISYQIDFIHRALLAASSATSGVHEYASSLPPCRRALRRTQSGITLFLTRNWYQLFLEYTT